MSDRPVVTDRVVDPVESDDRTVGSISGAEDITLLLPPGSPGAAPLVVLVPGGGWVDADPTGLLPLAGALTEAGAVVVPITYRTASDGAYFPLPAEDVACAIATSAGSAAAAGFPPDEVVVVGHSAGAHLATLVALRGDDFATDCGRPAVMVDRMVGLAGPYDVGRASGPAGALFGPDAEPSDWSAGNPIEYADRRPEVDALLLHGTSDGTVPAFFTEQFAEALVAGGHEVETIYLEGVDHHTVYSAEQAAPVIARWLGLDVTADDR